MTEKKEEEMTDLEYLKYSRDFLNDEAAKALEKLKTLKEEIKGLQEDIKIIQTDRLKKAAMDVHNRLVIEKRQVLERIKQARVDLKHVRSIYKQLREKEKK